MMDKHFLSRNYAESWIIFTFVLSSDPYLGNSNLNAQFGNTSVDHFFKNAADVQVLKKIR